jgi:HD-GYP domain-containing protein (c-di-GMP phosphodiesterase class II)
MRAYPKVLSPDRASGEESALAMEVALPSARDAQLTECVSQLRARIGENDPDGSGLVLLSKLSEAIECLRGERDGMAEELLGVYEQLGVVFEVTSRLPTVRSEPEVLDLFTDALQRSFQHDEVFFLAPFSNRPSGGANQWQHALMGSLRDKRRAVVETLPEVAELPHFREILFGPIFAGTNSSNESLESFVGAVSIARRRKGHPFHASDMLLVESLTIFCGDVIRNHRLVRELGETSVAMVQALVNAVDQKDPYTSGHSLRVGYYSTLLGKRLGLSDDDLQMLQWGALLHDVGKIGIRDEVLKKQGRLTEEEFDHIKEHPVRSHQVVREVPQLSDALDGVLHHHEHFDGGGYPSGLVGEDIPRQARIIQIADVFDALTSTRSYRTANDWSEALEIMRLESGTTLDPTLRLTFDELIRSAVEQEPAGWIGLTERANHFTKIGPQNSEINGGR